MQRKQEWWQEQKAPYQGHKETSAAAFFAATQPLKALCWYPVIHNWVAAIEEEFMVGPHQYYNTLRKV